MLDHITEVKYYTRLATPLDHLTTSNPLATVAKNYLIALKVEEKSPRTIESYTMVLKCFLMFDGSQEPTAYLIRQFLLYLQEGRRPSSVHLYYRTLKIFFNWMIGEGLLQKSPMENIKPPKVPKTIIKPFSRPDIDNLLLLCSGNRFLDLRNRAIILVFLDTGLRLAELSSIQLNDVDFDRETIKVMGKGSKERIVRIGKTAQKAVLKYLLSRNDDYPCLWVTEERRPLTRDGIKIMVKRLCRRAGIKDVKLGCHTFRHTFAINFLRNGGDIFTLQYALGHATLEMTRRYLSTLGIDDLIRVHQKVSPVDRLGLR